MPVGVYVRGALLLRCRGAVEVLVPALVRVCVQVVVHIPREQHTVARLGEAEAPGEVGVARFGGSDRNTWSVSAMSTYSSVI